MAILFLRLATIFLAASSVSSIVTDGDQNDDKWIIQPDDAPFFVAIVKRGNCGGALVSKRHVVTAAHCLCSNSAIMDTAPETVFSDGSKRTPSQLFFNPDCAFSCETDGPNRCDAAVLAYDDDIVDDDEGVSLAVYEWDDEEDKKITIYGYGLTGDADSLTTAAQCKAAGEDGKFRRAENIVTSTTGSPTTGGVIKYKMDRDGLDLEGISQDGDSGGPAVIQRNGKAYLAGVNSGTSESNPCDFGSVDQYARLSQHVDFIDKVMDGDDEISPVKNWGDDDDFDWSDALSEVVTFFADTK